MHRCTFPLILAAAALAQTPASQPAPPTASVSGTVRDAGTGAPLADARISAIRPGAKSVDAVTDSQGHYALRDLPAGQIGIMAIGPSETRGFGAIVRRPVTLTAGQELTGIDILIRAHAQISGRIIDQNKEPVPGASVRLIAREYAYGTLRYVFASTANTNDQGEYTVDRVEPGRGYLLMVQKAYRALGPISEAPVNPKLRKPAMIPTYYPGTSSIEGAQALVLSPGEKREGIDLQVLRTPSYCIDGVLQSGAGAGALRFGIQEKQPTSGASGEGAMFMGSPGGTSGPDGKIRICDLHPGVYEITAVPSAPGPMPASFGTTSVTIVDEDISKLNVAAHPRVTVPGEILWEGTPPDPPVSSPLNLRFPPMTRAPFPSEVTFPRPSIPGQFSLDLFVDDYAVQIAGVPPGAYIKDATYGGRSVLHEPLRPGSAVGEATLRITLARDGATINANVADKDNHPIADATVVVIPASFNSDAALAATMLSGKTDQNGAWSATLAPGKYYLLASDLPIDKSPECIGRLARSRTKAKEVEVGPSASVRVTLAPTRVD